MTESAEADISAWLPADPRHPIYTPFVEEYTWDDNVDRTLVVAALVVLAEHHLHEDPTVLEALETVPRGSYRTGWQAFVDLCRDERGLRLDIGSVEEYDSVIDTRHLRWRVGRKLHRQGGPAEAIHRGDVLLKLRWCLRGTEHRADGPSFQDRIASVYREGWQWLGIHGRPGGPCWMQWRNGELYRAARALSAGGMARGVMMSRGWHRGGVPEYVTCYEDGVVHRRDAPAYIRYSGQGCVDSEEWALNGLVSRPDGPAGRYYHGGVLIAEGYWIRGWLWREGGPAFWFQDADGGRHEVWTTRRHAGDRVRFEYRTVDADGHTSAHTLAPTVESLPGWRDWIRRPRPGTVATLHSAAGETW